MPIKWILQWQPNTGTTVNTQILVEISQCVESINGVKEGSWKNTFTFYKPILKEQANCSEFPRNILGISLHEQPNKYYMALSKQRLIMEAESSILTIMENLQSYKMKIALNCECFVKIEELPHSNITIYLIKSMKIEELREDKGLHGLQYRLGDFLLRVGKIIPINSENLREIVMEMEYLPISSWETSHQIMSEFFDIWKETLEKRLLPGHFVHVEPNFSEFGLSDQYTSQHTVVQYASILAQMVATSQATRK